MAETTARQLIISALIFTALVTGCFVFISAYLPEDNDNFQEYNTTFDKFSDIDANRQQIQEKMEDAEPSSGILGILNGLISASWGAIKLIWSSVTTMGTILGDLSSQFGVPVWFTGLLIAIIGVTVAFAVMAAIFKWHI